MYKRKAWLFLLAFSLLFAGCNTPAKDEKAKTQSKAGKKQAKLSAMQKLGDNEMEVVLFLNQAEHAVEEVYYAALDNPNGRTVYEDGLAYRELPRRFDSKEKIVRFFSHYWTKPLAEALYDNLSTKTVNEKVYVSLPRVDYPVLISVRNTSVQKNGGEINVTVDRVTDPSFSSDRSLRYRLTRDNKTKRFEITSRIGTYGREHFQ